MEVGVRKGGSLKLWRELYSDNSKIWGIDIAEFVPQFPRDANIKVFESLQITMNGRKRRMGDLGNVESPEDPMKIQLMIYNKEHIEEVLEFIKKNGFPAKNEEGSQFIHIRVPKPSRMQLEELGDDVVRRTNAVIARLVKIKTNTGLRIRAAVEKEFIDQRIAGVATKKIDVNLERCTKEIKIIGLMKRKKILGSFFKPVERDDVDFLKIISRRLKLEKSKVENENQLRIQTEALISENQNNETVNLDGVSTINQNVSPTQDTVSVN